MDKAMSKKACPNSVLMLYSKLYCQRRNEVGKSSKPKHKLMESIKSWVTLSESEKQILMMKFQECHLNHRKKLANYLSKTQPFLKKKVNNKTLQEHKNEVNTHDNEMEVDNCENHSTENKRINNSCHETSPELHIPDNEPDIIDETSYIVEQTNVAQYADKVVLTEPVPISIRNSRELFEMIQSDNEDDPSKTWAALNNTEKRQYRRALFILKTAYIQRFRAYLESLPSKELFQYYNKFFN